MKLRKLLEAAVDEEYFGLLWATYLLQTDNPKPAQRHFFPGGTPPDAIGANASFGRRIHEWELETLANQCLSTRKRHERGGRIRQLNGRSYNAIIECVRQLRAIENQEFHLGGHDKNIYLEMSRIGHRQFPWQVGSANIPNFYRNIYVYGQDGCARYFKDRYGIAIDRLAEISFALFVIFSTHASITASNGIPEMGISQKELERALDLLSQKHPAARRRAATLQRTSTHIAYKPSVLRRSPIIDFGKDARRLLCPLPPLIIDRFCSGLFYDVIDYPKSGAEFGQRFEAYCLELLQEMLSDVDWTPELRYGTKKRPKDSPDILGGKDQRIKLIIECKARRMSYSAMFANGPTPRDGIEDLGKAVKQIWSFCADNRRGLTGMTLDCDPLGVILTMDDWSTMGQGYIDRFFREAEQQIAASGDDIDERDRCPIVFLPIQDLERCLSIASYQSLLEAIETASQKKYLGWKFESILMKSPSHTQKAERAYPFTDRLSALLPWWGHTLEEGDPRNGADFAQ